MFQDDNIRMSILLEAQYACFNRRRSLRRADEGQPSVQETSGLIQIMDPSDPQNSYVNRLIIWQPISEHVLIDAMKQYETQNIAFSVDTMPHAIHAGLSTRLIHAGFAPAMEIMFLQRSMQETLGDN
ncbi:MAG TPA: hypothetical protein VE954_03465 [Oligoflexus sp.]|uniref:hypothetical protein n=1 Tax=Oligoflexus sp. TaxID=1971216 RepID=UPI002D608BEB|nr:hypothetical protein [Oligoflexus sp.]HYX32145.1 hypothetical protein [Oligoflexus sp.]